MSNLLNYLTDEYLLSLLEQKEGLVGKIVVAHWGYDTERNIFCMIVKDSDKTSVLMKLSTQNVELFDPPYIFRGKEIPILDESILNNKTEDRVFRVKKLTDSDGKVSFWGRNHLFWFWNGEPQSFDYLN